MRNEELGVTWAKFPSGEGCHGVTGWFCEAKPSRGFPAGQPLNPKS